MDWNKMFDLGGLNLWVVVSGNGLNLILEGIVLVVAALAGSSANGMGSVVLILGSFISTVLVAFICGKMERESYLRYAAYTLPGNLLLTVPSLFLGGLSGIMGGVMGVMVVTVSVLGAFNGARLAEMTTARHSF